MTNVQLILDPSQFSSNRFDRLNLTKKKNFYEKLIETPPPSIKTEEINCRVLTSRGGQFSRDTIL